MQNLSERDQRHIWHPLTQHKTHPGVLGIERASGVYLYDEAGKRLPDREVAGLLAPHVNKKGTFTDEQMVQRLIYSMVNEATFCLEEDVVGTAEAIDAAVILGAGFPPFTGGLLRYADKVGVRSLVDTLDDLAEKVDSRFTPSGTLKKMAKRDEVFYS